MLAAPKTMRIVLAWYLAQYEIPDAPEPIAEVQAETNHIHKMEATTAARMIAAAATLAEDTP